MTAPRTSSVVALVAAAVALLAGASRLASASLGTTLRARTCDSSPLLGLALFAVGGGLLVFSVTSHLRSTAHQMPLRFERRSVAWAAPLPVILLALTLPGTLGCRAAQHFEHLPLVGDALIGFSGAMLAASAATLVGVALGGAWSAPTSVVAGRDHEDPTTTIIEQAIADAHDPHSGRFRGVDH
ncbi:MAG: hypothetical protein JWN41_253 [Thermoleophilia bacterium]|nr:hypothetical protein [Thermoleophilia bacterium]